jgi:hypothetical protein
VERNSARAVDTSSRGTSRTLEARNEIRSRSPYAVRIYDPFLQTSSTVRYTGSRLTVGGQLLDRIDQPGGHDENALVYIDDIGKGHNPY